MQIKPSYRIVKKQKESEHDMKRKLALVLSFVFVLTVFSGTLVLKAEDEETIITVTNWGEVSDSDVNKIVTNEFN